MRVTLSFPCLNDSVFRMCSYAARLEGRVARMRSGRVPLGVSGGRPLPGCVSRRHQSRLSPFGQLLDRPLPCGVGYARLGQEPRASAVVGVFPRMPCVTSVPAITVEKRVWACSSGGRKKTRQLGREDELQTGLSGFRPRDVPAPQEDVPGARRPLVQLYAPRPCPRPPSLPPGRPVPTRLQPRCRRIIQTHAKLMDGHSRR